MDKQNKNSIEEYLVYEDKQKLNTLKTTLTVRPNGAYLSLIGVDTPELLEVFKNYLLTFQNTKLFNYKSEQIIDEIISSNEDKTLIIDIFNLKDDFKIEKSIQNFRFNRDFIPDKNIRIFILASNETLDKFSEMAYDFVTFSNFYGKFNNNKFDFKYEINREKLEKLIKKYKELKPNTPKLIQLENMSKVIEEAIAINDKTTAIKYLNIALLKSRKFKNTYLEIYFLNLFGKIYINNNNNELALKYYDQALSITDDNEDKAMILGNKANIYTNLKQFNKAFSLLEKAIKINKKIGRITGLAINYANIGSIYHGGENFKALEYYFLSLEAQKELNDKVGIVTNYIGIGQVYELLYNYEKSLFYLNKALKLAEINKYKNLLIKILISLGVVYKKQLNFEISLKYFNEALFLSKQLNYKKDIETSLTNIHEINQYLLIDTTNDEIIIPNKDSEDKEEQIKYLIYKSNELQKEDNLKEVKEKLQEAQGLADEINLKGSQCEVYMAFYDYYKTINDEKNAQSYYNKANYIIKNSGHKLFEKRLEDIKLSHTKS